MTIQVNQLPILNKILKNIEVNKDENLIEFHCDDNITYYMEHHQDCCEAVTIEDICGNLDNLIGAPLLEAEEVCSENYEDILAQTDKVAAVKLALRGTPDKPNYEDSQTWTFYKFSTIKGSVTIRWYGSSNGYYSESISFSKSRDSWSC